MPGREKAVIATFLFCIFVRPAPPHIQSTFFADVKLNFVTKNPARKPRATAEQKNTDPQSGGPKIIYAERLWIPLWWWAFAVFVIATVVVQGVFIKSPWWVWLILILFSSLILWLLWRLGRETIQISDDGAGNITLIAGGAPLPGEMIARCAVVPASAKQAAMGRQLDPEAYVVHRGFVRTMAIVVLDDPEDPTPYWLISTRNPEHLTELLPGKTTV